jgi:hypothetical protein
MSERQIETVEKHPNIVIASKAKQSRFFISQSIIDCFVAFAPRNDSKKGLFQQSQIA